MEEHSQRLGNRHAFEAYRGSWSGAFLSNDPMTKPDHGADDADACDDDDDFVFVF